jgi:prostaglandin-H2 D-isomerase / glutathione transferase
MSTYKLYYFDARGRAEIARLIFAAAGEKFEDIRYERAQWPSHKSEMPLGQMPTLEVDGVKLPQSMAIARFLAKQFGLAGSDYLEQAKVDAVVDTSIDLAMKYIPIHFEPDDAKKSIEMQKFFAEELPKHLRNLENLANMYSNGGSFFVGNQLTWCDLEVYDMLDFLLPINGKFLDSHPWLLKHRQEVAQHPKIAAYLKNRPPA